MIKFIDMDTIPHWEEDKGRWICRNESIAYNTAEEHPGDSVYTYDRDSDGRIYNIRPYWTPTMTDKHKMPSIKGGKLRWKN